MFYKQSVQDIKLVVLSLDGGILELNRLRYNYFKKICKTYEQTIDLEVFAQGLGNFSTMYDCSPISDKVTNKDLNLLIERDLFEYSKLKQNIKRDGVDELLKFFHQKDIKIAIISTHKTKRAMQYLQLAGIYNDVDFIIGGDCNLPMLPNKDILMNISQQMNVAPENMMVIANFYNLVLAANHALMNVIYINDLLPADEKIRASTFKCAKNNLEIINIFLFSKYESLDMYSPLLGMSEKMNREQLTDTYHKLLQKYTSDSQLVSLVNSTYNYYIDLLNAKELDDESKYDNLEDKFEDEEEYEEIESEDVPQLNEEESQLEQTQETPSNEQNDTQEYEDTFISAPILENEEIEEDYNEEIEEENEVVKDEDFEGNENEIDLTDDASNQNLTYTSAIRIDKDRMDELMGVIGGNDDNSPKEVIDAKKEEVNASNNFDNSNEDVDLTMTSAITADAMRINELMDVINGSETEETSNNVEQTQEIVEVEPKSTVLDKIVSFLVVLLTNMLIVIIAMIFNVVIVDFLQSNSVLGNICNAVVSVYIDIVRNFVGLIFNGLHSIIGMIPNYEELMVGNSVLSGAAIEGIYFVIFNTVIYYICYGIYVLICKFYDNDDEDNQGLI